MVNRCVESYLRCMCRENPEWYLWLPLAEWWYNTHFHSSIRLTPYEVVYDQPPPLHLPYLARDDTNAEVDRRMVRRENMIRNLKTQSSWLIVIKLR